MAQPLREVFVVIGECLKVVGQLAADDLACLIVELEDGLQELVQCGFTQHYGRKQDARDIILSEVVEHVISSFD